MKPLSQAVFFVEGVVMNYSINQAIKDNEITAVDWELSELAKELYDWVDTFNIELFKNQKVPVPAISFEKTRVSSLGHYVIGRNAFGVSENININRIHLKRPIWDILATLLHELSHSWQYIHGKPSKSWYHNHEFQQKMLSFGIVTDPKGFHHSINKPFTMLLQEKGVIIGSGENQGGILTPPTSQPKGSSKLKKWTCACGQSARIGRKEFNAICPICWSMFKPDRQVTSNR